jgi:hypothetical protein
MNNREVMQRALAALKESNVLLITNNVPEQYVIDENRQIICDLRTALEAEPTDHNDPLNVDFSTATVSIPSRLASLRQSHSALRPLSLNGLRTFQKLVTPSTQHRSWKRSYTPSIQKSCGTSPLPRQSSLWNLATQSVLL